VLTAIKVLHTVIWAFLAASILALPVAGVLRRFRWAAILTVIVLLECGVLAVNGGRCPLSDMAARYTDERASNFDIYLPNWLASHNKAIFGTLFVVGELIVLMVLAETGTIIIGQRRRQPVMQVVKAGAVYFALVFGAGFVLGTIRTLWVVPRFGTRMAELMEMPIMLAVTIVAARWTVLCLSVPIKEYFATRDPVSGAAYYLLLIVFAVMPLVR
jgi:hypothetical protein